MLIMDSDTYKFSEQVGIIHTVQIGFDEIS